MDQMQVNFEYAAEWRMKELSERKRWWRRASRKKLFRSAYKMYNKGFKLNPYLSSFKCLHEIDLRGQWNSDHIQSIFDYFDLIQVKIYWQAKPFPP
jgi:hypothetical protein